MGRPTAYADTYNSVVYRSASRLSRPRNGFHLIPDHRIIESSNSGILELDHQRLGLHQAVRRRSYEHGLELGWNESDRIKAPTVNTAE